MTEQKDAQRLIETWKEHFEAEGFNPEESQRMAKVAAGPTAVAQAHGGAVSLTEAFADRFEAKGETLAVAKAMGAVASGEINPSPRLTGSEIVNIVEGREASRTVGRRGGEKPRRQSRRRNAGGLRDVDLTEHQGNLGHIVLEGEP